MPRSKHILEPGRRRQEAFRGSEDHGIEEIFVHDDGAEGAGRQDRNNFVVPLAAPHLHLHARYVGKAHANSLEHVRPLMMTDSKLCGACTAIR
jgi:hypothetical protein